LNSEAETILGSLGFDFGPWQVAWNKHIGGSVPKPYFGGKFWLRETGGGRVWRDDIGAFERKPNDRRVPEITLYVWRWTIYISHDGLTREQRAENRRSRREEAEWLAQHGGDAETVPECGRFYVRRNDWGDDAAA
jgi:hypothetical protein